MLGQGRFGFCKLVSLSVSGGSVKVAVKHYTELTPKEAVIDEACLLSRISHEAFPFVFGVVFGGLHNLLIIEALELQRGLNIHLPFVELCNQKVYVSLKCHGYTF